MTSTSVYTVNPQIIICSVLFFSGFCLLPNVEKFTYLQSPVDVCLKANNLVRQNIQRENFTKVDTTRWKEKQY